MPDWLAQLRAIVWTAVLAAGAGLASVTAALGGANTETVLSLGLLGVNLAVLSIRQ